MKNKVIITSEQVNRALSGEVVVIISAPPKGYMINMLPNLEYEIIKSSPNEREQLLPPNYSPKI